MIKQNCTTYFFSLQNLIIKIEYAWPTTSLFPIKIPLSFKQRIMEQRSCSWWFSFDHLSLFTLSSLFSFIFDLQTQPFCSILNSFFLQYTKCQMSKLVPHKMYKMSSREHNIKVLKNVLWPQFRSLCQSFRTLAIAIAATIASNIQDHDEIVTVTAI